MLKDPDRTEGCKLHVASFRHDELSLNQVNEILSENQLYTNAYIIRGAIQALFNMSEEQRANEIMNREGMRDKKNYTFSVRLSERSYVQVLKILEDNPLYRPSHVIRGAIQALFRMTKENRRIEILSFDDRQER